MKSRQYENLEPIVGLHSLNDKKIVISKTGQIMIDNLNTKVTEDVHELKGSHVHKTYLRGERMAACSKGTPIQIWDVSAQKEVWLAKNVRNDELDL